MRSDAGIKGDKYVSTPAVMPPVESPSTRELRTASEDLAVVRTFGDDDLKIESLEIGGIDAADTLKIGLHGEGNVEIEKLAGTLEVQDGTLAITP